MFSTVGHAGKSGKGHDEIHFGVDLGPEFALEGEETLLMALVMRQLRTRRLTRKGASK